LALEESTEPTTVGELVNALTEILNTELEGYKGGEFLMDSSVPVWISPFGVATQIAIMDVDLKDGEVVVTTKFIS